MSDDDTIAGWQKIMEMVRKCDLPLTLPDNLENLMNSRRELTKQLKEFSENVRTQENIVCFFKGVCAAGTIIGAGLTFSSFFPLGVGITAVSSAVLDLVNIFDWFAEKWKDRKLDKMLEKDQELTELFINDMKKLDLFCKYFLREKITTSRDEGNGIAISTLMLGKSVATDVSSTIALWKPLKDIFSNGILRYPSTACVTCGKKAKDSLGFVSRSLPVITALIASIDFVFSCLSTKPCRAKADKAKNVVDENVSYLNELKKIIDEVKNR